MTHLIILILFGMREKYPFLKYGFHLCSLNLNNGNEFDVLEGHIKICYSVKYDSF